MYLSVLIKKENLLQNKFKLKHNYFITILVQNKNKIKMGLLKI